MDWKTKYKDKLLPMEEAVKLVHSDDNVIAGIATGIPYALLDAIANYARTSLNNVTVYMGGGFKKYMAGMPPYNGHLNIKSFFYAIMERKAAEMGSNISYQPIHLSNTTYDRIHKHHPNVLIAAGTAPDENGIISLGPSPMDTALIEAADVVIIQVNKNIPYVYGVDCMCPVDKVTALVEFDEDIPVLGGISPSPTDVKMAEYIVEMIPNGACIQLGIGGTARAVGKFLKDKKDLGIHTEMFTDTFVELIECGAVNNSRKNFCPGKTELGFALGTKEMYDFMHRNPTIEARPFSWVNDPRIIAQNDNMMSINGAMQIDLTGQVCAESVGMRQYSGTGGQGDYVRGARMSKGGKSFLALPSTHTDKEGNVTSKISLALPLGSVVTTLRTDVQYIVTEYGIADLQNEPVDERVKRLIAIAHPDFRDQLRFDAKKAGLLI